MALNHEEINGEIQKHRVMKTQELWVKKRSDERSPSDQTDLFQKPKSRKEKYESALSHLKFSPNICDQGLLSKQFQPQSRKDDVV